MTEEIDQKTVDLELDMWIEMKKYFEYDIVNQNKYLQQLAAVNEQLKREPTPKNLQAIQNNQISMGSLLQRRNFAANCISFLWRKIQQWKKPKKSQN